MTIFANRRLGYDYEILDKLEVGIILLGWEVKSVKNGRSDWSSTFCFVDTKGQLWLRGATISKWTTGPAQSEELRKRDRKLLAHKSQIAKLQAAAKQPGYTLMVQDVYTNQAGIIKVGVAIVKGKKKYGRKQEVKERDLRREHQRDQKGQKY